MSSLAPVEINRMNSDYEYKVAESSRVYEFVYMTEEHVTEEQLNQLVLTSPQKELRWRHVSPEEDSDSIIGRILNASMAQVTYNDLDKPLWAAIIEAELYGDSPEQLQAQTLIAESLSDPQNLTPLGVSSGFYVQTADNDDHLRTLSREGSITHKPRCLRCRATQETTQNYRDVKMSENETITVQVPKQSVQKALADSDSNGDATQNNQVPPKPEEQNGNGQAPAPEQTPPNPDEQPENQPAQPPAQEPQAPAPEQAPEQPRGTEGEGTQVEQVASALMDAAASLGEAAKKLDTAVDGEAEQTTDPNKDKTEENTMSKENARTQYSAYEKSETDKNVIMARYKQLKVERQNKIQSYEKIETYENKLESANAQIKKYEEASRELARRVIEKDQRIQQLEKELEEKTLTPVRTQLANYELDSNPSEDKIKEKLVFYEEMNFSEKQLKHMISQHENATQKYTKGDNLPVIKAGDNNLANWEKEKDPATAWKAFSGQ